MPHVYTSPFLFNAIALLSPAAISTTSVSCCKSSFITLTGSFEFSVLLFPNWPFVFFPHDHTVPFAFNAIVKSVPSFICGVTKSPLFTLIIMYVEYPFAKSVIFIFVFPTLFAVIFPVLSTVAILVSRD